MFFKITWLLQKGKQKEVNSPPYPQLPFHIGFTSFILLTHSEHLLCARNWLNKWWSLWNHGISLPKAGLQKVFSLNNVHGLSSISLYSRFSFLIACVEWHFILWPYHLPSWYALFSKSSHKPHLDHSRHTLCSPCLQRLVVKHRSVCVMGPR